MLIDAPNNLSSVPLQNFFRLSFFFWELSSFLLLLVGVSYFCDDVDEDAALHRNSTLDTPDHYLLVWGAGRCWPRDTWPGTWSGWGTSPVPQASDGLERSAAAWTRWQGILGSGSCAAALSASFPPVRRWNPTTLSCRRKKKGTNCGNFTK